VLLLAIGIALPTTVFIWTEAGARITVEDYFDHSIYQFRVESDIRLTPSERNYIINKATAWPEIELGHAISTTIGMITGSEVSDWDYYQMITANYLLGIKDARVIPVENEILDLWESEFSYRGNFSLSPRCVLVSENFIKYTYDCLGFEIDIGSEIQFQILTRLGVGMRNYGLREDFEPVNTTTLTIIGVYKIKSLLSQLSKAFPSYSRDNWHPGTPIDPEPVLGIDDSIMILKSEMTEEANQQIDSRGFFPPDVLLRASLGTLFTTSAKEAPNTLEETKTD
ncbi:MAG: hypothetical protein P1Q69_19180, partial [Candidatus Thorarchaeota archaeon]|nr:hypothetical protein [Candidatus Thorarchaeota archaeon]